jgi:hypothetical protein
VPRTHEAFQQVMIELSQSKKSREEKEDNQETSSTRDFNICGMGRNKEDDYVVIQDLHGTGRDESKDNLKPVFPTNIHGIFFKSLIYLVYFVVTARVLFAVMVSYHSNYLNYKSQHGNSLIKLKVSVIHFALTARSLFAAWVSHHDNYISDWNKRNCLFEKNVHWKVNILDFREVLINNDRKCFHLVKWMDDPHIRNDGECYAKVFNVLHYLV